jgi:hypothetical protein
MIEIGKRYVDGPVSVKVKEIREDILIRDSFGTWSVLVVCDTPSTTKDIGLPLNDMASNFQEDTNAG